MALLLITGVNSERTNVKWIYLSIFLEWSRPLFNLYTRDHDREQVAPYVRYACFRRKIYCLGEFLPGNFPTPWGHFPTLGGEGKTGKQTLDPFSRFLGAIYCLAAFRAGAICLAYF